MKTWQANVTDVTVPHTVDHFADTAESVYDDIRNGDRIDLLSLLERDGLNPYHMSMIIRATYIFRSQVDGWYEARDRAYQDFIDGGIDPKGAMYGLMDVTPDDTYKGHPIIRDLLAGNSQ